MVQLANSLEALHNNISTMEDAIAKYVATADIKSPAYHQTMLTYALRRLDMVEELERITKQIGAQPPVTPFTSVWLKRSSLGKRKHRDFE